MIERHIAIGVIGACVLNVVGLVWWQMSQHNAGMMMFDTAMLAVLIAMFSGVASRWN